MNSIRWSDRVTGGTGRACPRISSSACLRPGSCWIG